MSPISFAGPPPWLQQSRRAGHPAHGSGQSLCYQLPALSRYDKTGALTVMISPLVALMADQVAGLETCGIGSCVTVNGLLSMPERADTLERVRLGDAGIPLISPEQLRSFSLQRALDQVGSSHWHCGERIPELTLSPPVHHVR